MIRKGVFPFLLTVLLSGCLPHSPPEPTRVEERPGLRVLHEGFPFPDDGEAPSLRRAIEKSLAFFEKRIAEGNRPRPNPGSMESLFPPEKNLRTLTLFRALYFSEADPLRRETTVRENFDFFVRADEAASPPLLLTGYFEPVFEGSLEEREGFRYPLYRLPDDLVEIPEGGGSPGEKGERKIGRIREGRSLPYYSREEIDGGGVLRGRGLELVWLRDPWDGFVLHIQGSGRVRTPEGKILRLGFAGSNGRPYRGIGRYLVEKGFLGEEALSLSRVRAFLRDNPNRAEEILNQNERYIFFRITEGTEGPFGSLGVPLTAGRSIATDPRFYPAGGLAYLAGSRPVLDERGVRTGKAPLGRFVLNQDAGAAIKGNGRVDFFWGTGEAAGFMAGEMREEGRLYFLREKGDDSQVGLPIEPFRPRLAGGVRPF